MQHEHYTHTAPDIPSSTFICPSFSPYQQATFASGCTGKFVRYCFCGIPICRPLLSELHAEITAVISTPQRHASLPDQLRMQPGIADVIAVTKTAAQLWAAVFCAGVVIGTLHHIHTPDAVTGLQFFWDKARRRTENAPGGFDEKRLEQVGKAPVCAAGRQAVCGSFSPSAPHSRERFAVPPLSA